MDESTNVTPAKKGNMLWYIVAGVVIVLALVAVTARGLGGAAMRAAGAANGVDVQQQGNGSVTYSNDQGSVTVGGAATMPANWPSDAPANFAGASIQYSGESNPQTGQKGAAVVYSVSASAQSVVDYYKAQLAKDGWTIEATANTGVATVLSAKKDTRTFGVYIVSTGDKVSVTAGLGM